MATLAGQMVQPRWAVLAGVGRELGMALMTCLVVVEVAGQLQRPQRVRRQRARLQPGRLLAELPRHATGLMGTVAEKQAAVEVRAAQVVVEAVEAKTVVEKMVPVAEGREMERMAMRVRMVMVKGRSGVTVPVPVPVPEREGSQAPQAAEMRQQRGSLLDRVALAQIAPPWEAPRPMDVVVETWMLMRKVANAAVALERTRILTRILSLTSLGPCSGSKKVQVKQLLISLQGYCCPLSCADPASLVTRQMVKRRRRTMMTTPCYRPGGMGLSSQPCAAGLPRSSVRPLKRLGQRLSLRL
mmetsp:Transcript_149288/g.371792  ORF Transcript_149288/g.371792 Transcript_149288/m.371792 type:complete len:299 (+) Transcript_149288:1102-1998(+)